MFTPEILLEAIGRYRVTTLYTAPTGYRAMTELAHKYNLTSLETCVSAGETLPLPTFDGWHQATGIKIIDGLGSTEMLHIFISASGNDIRPGATGKAIPGYEARVVDDAGDDVPSGAPGNLAVRGPTGCRYLDGCGAATQICAGPVEFSRQYLRSGQCRLFPLISITKHALTI